MEAVFTEMDRFAKDVKSYCIRSLALSVPAKGNPGGRLHPFIRAKSITSILSRRWPWTSSNGEAGVVRSQSYKERGASSAWGSPAPTGLGAGAVVGSSMTVPENDAQDSWPAGGITTTEGSRNGNDDNLGGMRVGGGVTLAGLDAEAAAGIGDESGSNTVGRGRQEQQAKLCAVVAAQWKRSAVTMARSRCISSGSGDDARERREVSARESVFLATTITLS